MIYLDNYRTDFMYLVIMVYVTYSSIKLSHNCQFPFRFQDITFACLNLCLHVLEMKFIHKLQQNE